MPTNQPTDEELAAWRKWTLHTRWQSEVEHDPPACMCDRCRQLRRDLWNRTELP